MTEVGGGAEMGEGMGRGRMEEEGGGGGLDVMGLEGGEWKRETDSEGRSRTDKE